jgi:acetyltransferase-like isoleucine patch superfamily enzyme
VHVGSDVLMAAYTYLVGGDHLYDRVDIPVLQQGRTARGIDVGAGVWLGTHVVVTDGSRVGRDAIIGAGAVVVGEIPEFAIAVGTPAKVLRDRRAEGAAPSASPESPVPSP